MMKEFITDLEELLHATPYQSVDILPLVEKYTNGKTPNERSSIRITIQGLLNQYKQAEWIEGKDFHAQLAWQRPTHIEGISEDPILIRSTIKFEEYYTKKNTLPVQPITYNQTTYGSQSPIAGHDMTIGEIKSNEESEESKELARAQLKDIPKNSSDRRWMLIWTIVIALAAVVTLLLLLRGKG